MGIYRLIILFLLGALTLQVEAQDEFVPIDGEPRIKVVFYKKVQKEFYQGDSITVIIMPELPVYPPLKFKNKREAMRYNKLVYNVKKTLPIAKMVNQTISETYEYLEKLPTKKEKDAHIRAVEKGIKKQYTPQMKKLTAHQVSGPRMQPKFFRNSESLFRPFQSRILPNVCQHIRSQPKKRL